MSRIRTIKPEFFRHERLQDMEIERPELRPMLVFIGLWTQCDSKGRFEWKPRTLKLDILPFLDLDMGVSLLFLWENELIFRYESGGKTYGFIPSFSKHQRITGKEHESGERYPEPPENIEQFSGETKKINGETPGKHPESQEQGKEQGKGKGTGKGLGAQSDNGETPVITFAADSVPVITLPLADGTEHPVHREEIEEFSKLYPAVDVLQHLRNMRGWCLANPTRCKTRKGIRRFMNSWLEDKQNKGGVAVLSPRPQTIAEKNSAMLRKYSAMCDEQKNTLEGDYARI